jgi:transcriptional regulator of arginine metabolism
MAGNLVVVKTVSGMGSAVGAAVDAMKMDKVVGSIAGDDTLLLVIRTEDDARNIVEHLRVLTT